MKRKSILIVEDSYEQLERYKQLCEKDMTVYIARSKAEALSRLQMSHVDFVLSDIHLTASMEQNSYEGFDILKYCKEHHPETLAMVMSSDPKIDTYHKAKSLGAIQFIRKPILSYDELSIAFQTALERHRLLRWKANQSKEQPLPASLADKCHDGVVFSEKLRNLARGLANNKEISVTIHGETGTGKEEFTKLIHKHRVEQEGVVPFIAVNCSSLDSDLASSAIFGHLKGAFTGAERTTEGYIGEADGGILFLDEIQNLPMDTQKRLLRVLNDGSYQRVGDSRELSSDFQLVVATTCDLDQMVADGNFLLDLRTRILGFDVHLPPLRERMEELDILVPLFLAKQNVQVPEAELKRIIDHCSQYYWQGNIRLLHKAIQAMCFAATLNEEPLQAGHLPVYRSMLAPESNDEEDADSTGLSPEVMEPFHKTLPLKEAVERYEKLVLVHNIKKYRKFSELLTHLQLSRSAFDAKRKKYAIV